MARRNSNGEGTIYRRKDGRYEGAVYVLTTGGTRKRVRVYGATRAEVHAKLTEAKAKNQQGMPVADKSWLLGDYLDYWLAEVIKPNRRATTYDLYESNVRLYIKPSLGRIALSRLSIPMLQSFLNRHLAEGRSARKVQTLREIISSALTRAMREEHITRNVARLVEVQSQQREPIEPWTLEEVSRFLDAAHMHQWFPAFLLIALYGLRRGEAMGVRWSDLDFSKQIIHIRQQVFRAGGKVQQGPLKTQAGRRDLPMLPIVSEVLQQHAITRKGSAELLITTETGQLVEPNNFTRAFKRLCARNGLRPIKLHHLRHTTATILKDLGIPARDVQLILGHSTIAVTQQIYQHDTMDSRRDALSRMRVALIPSGGEVQAAGAIDGSGSRQISRQTLTGSLLSDQIKSPRGSKNKPATGVPVAGWLNDFFGDLTGNRTRIARMKTRNTPVCGGVQERVIEVRHLAQVRERQWILGTVAVNLAVNYELETRDPLE
ncbi:site-specific integrase [Streptomyces sp. NPDC046685]|uniref:tyrosine-type recombinase/integrase n=1 Tax=Streptomyces sp. NPDC046685 TaxID=3157202 RepID=UPI0033E277CD